MIANFGNVSYEGTPQELREYFVDTINKDSLEGECGFGVIFIDCDSEEVSEELVGDDASQLEKVVEAFCRAYERSGFCNELTITIGNRIFGDKTYKVEAKH